MHFIYDESTGKTIAVVKAAIEPDALIPSSEDAVSVISQWEAVLAGHRLKSYPLPSGAYGEALKLFHQGDELMLHLDKFDSRAMDKARGRREERRRKRGVTEAMKAEVLGRHDKGQTNTYIARKLEMGASTVSEIVRAANTENDAPQAPEHAA